MLSATASGSDHKPLTYWQSAARMAEQVADEDLLRGRDHNFPDCFDGIEILPDCRPLLEEFYRLVRQAQKDFRFANIWEHRQTRKVLVAGFATLGEAIRSLEATVVRSIADLKKTIEARTIQASPTNMAKRVALRAFLPFPLVI